MLPTSRHCNFFAEPPDPPLLPAAIQSTGVEQQEIEGKNLFATLHAPTPKQPKVLAMKTLLQLAVGVVLIAYGVHAQGSGSGSSGSGSE